MKILIIIDEFIGSNGVSKVNSELVKEWKKLGNSVSMITFKSDNFTNLKIKTVDKFLFPKKSDISKVEKIIKQEEPHIIFCNAGRLSNAIPKKYSTVCRYGGSFPFDLIHTFKDGLRIFLGSAVLQFIQFLSMRKSGILISPSKYSSRINKRFFRKQFICIKNGMNSDNAPKKKIKLGKNSILFIGEIRHSKGISFLVDAFKLVREEVPSAKLHVFGKNSNENLLKKIISTDGIKYHGTTKNVFPYLRGCDIFAFPSYSESFGLVLLEAQSCGKPVIAFNTTAIPEVVKNNETGFLVEKKDINDFVEKTIFLLKNPDKSKKMGQAGKNFSKKFNWEKSAKEYLKVFEEVISSKN